MTQVDVIVPVFNTPLHFVGVALDSLREQTHTGWTAWIVDDGSPDSYATALSEVLAAYGDSRLKFVRAEHSGPAGSRNIGILKGNSPYVAFLDSDDCWLPSHLSRQLATLEADDRFVLAHGHRRIIDAEGRCQPTDPPQNGLDNLDPAQFLVRMLRENFVNASSVVVRRSALTRAGNFDASFPCLVDKELWLRLLKGGARFRYDTEVVLLYRVHAQNISKKTDLLLETRQRIIAKAEAIIAGHPQYAGIDWQALKEDMKRHMYLEAADAHFDQKRYWMALKYSAPRHSGLSAPAVKLMLRSLARILLRH